MLILKKQYSRSDASLYLLGLRDKNLPVMAEKGCYHLKPPHEEVSAQRHRYPSTSLPRCIFSFLMIFIEIQKFHFKMCRFSGMPLVLGIFMGTNL